MEEKYYTYLQRVFLTYFDNIFKKNTYKYCYSNCHIFVCLYNKNKIQLWNRVAQEICSWEETIELHKFMQHVYNKNWSILKKIVLKRHKIILNYLNSTWAVWVDVKYKYLIQHNF